MVSLYAMRGATFPPHPHAGFMVATYILPESEIGFVNQDSLGTHKRIAPGSRHVTLAGRGVLHEEQPEVEGRLAQGFQIWIDLPDAEREATPQALHLTAASVPRQASEGAEGARFTLFSGTPLKQPCLMHGPFVARDAQQLARFAHDHAAGRFGHLPPLARV